jgi:hypothetical protein
MELVANIWPIVDEASSLIQRFAARSYAMDAGDSAIASTLKVLSRSDFMIAPQFVVPQRYNFVNEHGTLHRTITVDLFNRDQAGVIEDALKALESRRQPLQSIGFDAHRVPFYKHVDLKFPANPYIVITFVFEDRFGNLRVHSTG